MKTHVSHYGAIRAWRFRSLSGGAPVAFRLTDKSNSAIFKDSWTLSSGLTPSASARDARKRAACYGISPPACFAREGEVGLYV